MPPGVTPKSSVKLRLPPSSSKIPLLPSPQSWIESQQEISYPHATEIISLNTDKPPRSSSPGSLNDQTTHWLEMLSPSGRKPVINCWKTPTLPKGGDYQPFILSTPMVPVHGKDPTYYIICSTK